MASVRWNCATTPGTAGDAAPTPDGSLATLPDPMAAPPTNGYFVQVAAVSKQEDAVALVGALKKKQYPAFSNISTIVSISTSRDTAVGLSIHHVMTRANMPVTACATTLT